MASDDSVPGRSYGPYDFDPHIRRLILDVLASDEALAIMAAAQRRSLSRVDAAGAGSIEAGHILQPMTSPSAERETT